MSTLSSRGYKQYLANNKNIMGKITTVDNNYFADADNIDYYGNDINFYKGMNKTDCAPKCDNDVNCVGFAVDPNGCWTKNALKSQYVKNNLKTYIKSNTKPTSSNSNLRQLNFSCPSVNGETCYDDVTKLSPPQKINQLSCNTTFDPNNIAKTLKFNDGPNFINSKTCQNIFTNYNLYPTNNPLAVIGSDINTNIINTITDPIQISNLTNQYQNSFKNVNSTDVTNNINKVLQETPLKIACCNRNNNVNTETLISSIKGSLSPQVFKENKTFAELNYENKNFEIPANTCPANLTSNSDDCNVFYATYCQNYYNYLKSKGLLDADILKQIPDCGCYFPNSIAQKNYPKDAPSICYKDGCEKDSISYLDPSSEGKQCNLTVCQNILNSTDPSTKINPTLEKNCGQYISKDTKNNNISSKNSTNNNSNNQDNTTLYIVITIIVIIIIIVIIYFVFLKK